MFVFHSRLYPEITEPRSLLAKVQAAFINEYVEGHNIIRISDPRSRSLNFVRLAEEVEKVMGEACDSLEWIAEGGANQLYLVTLLSGKQIVARLSFPYPYRVRDGEEFAYQEELDRARIPYKMQSEVATIRYLKDHHVDIPLAEIYAYDDHVDNSVGAPYTLQSLIPGETLNYLWLKFDYSRRSRTIEALGAIYGKIISLHFGSYGSLDASGTVGAVVEPISSISRYHPLTDAGPWPQSAPEAFFVALAIRERDWMETATGRKSLAISRAEILPDEDFTVAEPILVELTDRLVDIVRNMYLLFPIPEKACLPVLKHADFHFSNILVSTDDPTVVTGVVDWEFAAALPLWFAYEDPSVIRDRGDRYETNPERREEKAKLRDQFGQAVVNVCPYAAIVAQPTDEQTKRSLRGLRNLAFLATEGVTLYMSCSVIKAKVVELRQCVVAGNDAGAELLDGLVDIFAQVT